MQKNPKIHLSDFILAFSRVLDFVSPQVANHHLRVAIIASEIAQAFGVSRRETAEIFLAATIHDIGVFSMQEKFEALEFEMANPHLHAERGYLLAKEYNLFSGAAKIIRHHHTHWDHGSGRRSLGEEVPLGAHILHLADRIEVLICRNTEILSQKKHIAAAIKCHSGKLFMPELLEAFEDLAVRESFWFDATSPEIPQIIADREALPHHELNTQELLGISRIFSHVIDYRSTFTAVHSAGVSAVASLLAQMMGFSDTECVMMTIAGFLHDIGKLAIPPEILDKPGKLTEGEFNIIKSHVYHSYRVLEGVAGLGTIHTWGALHHERIDGTGYPFRLKGNSLPIGSRIMAVADVFTAVTEDRPYRSGMTGEHALKVIQDMAQNSALDHSIVGIASTYFGHLNDIRIQEQRKASAGYQSIKQLLNGGQRS
ncbi:MAG: HD domain-containing protein [Nitrospirales bacterium]|nr:HD domain-containing protein [Nitrospirales bacterium]